MPAPAPAPLPFVSVEEYLANETKPSSEYEDGVVTQKPMATWGHGFVQKRISRLIDDYGPHLESVTEVHVRIREGKYLVPDAIAQRKDHIQRPYPQEPVALCVEILSPSDLFGETLLKCEAYHAWGVDTTWILDPEARRAWLYRKGHRPEEIPAAGHLTAEGLSVPLAEVFQGL